jgi:hypothetical protein
LKLCQGNQAGCGGWADIATGGPGALAVSAAEVNIDADGAGHGNSRRCQSTTQGRKTEVLNPICVHSESPSEMENQSFEKLLKVRRALSFKLFPYNDISLAACDSVRMRKSLKQFT